MLRLPLLLALAAIFALPPASLRAGDDPLAHLRAGHPRLIFTDGQLVAAQAAAKADPLRASLHEHIVATAESILHAPPLRHNSGRAVHEQERYAVYDILTCAMAYRLTGDSRFAARVRNDLLTVCAFPDWEPSNDLAIGEMSFAVSVGYDWLYSELGPESRAIVRQALADHALSFADRSYAAEAAWTLREGNHSEVCNAGMISAALALADEEPALARRVLAGARSSLLHPLSDYAPDGAWPEGSGYWSYGTTYAAIAVAELEGALGSDLGLSASPGFSRTIDFYEAMQGPFERPFNFGDCTEDPQNSPVRAWLSERYHAAAARRHTRELLQAQLRREPVIPFDRAIQGTVINRFFALHAVWFPEAPAGTASELPLDSHFAGPADVASFRSAWGDPGALYVAFKAGENGVGHSHLDLGSFVLDADGQRWAVDLGGDTSEGIYVLPGYFDLRARRWTYFRTNNFSHNTVTPGDVLQLRNVRAPITGFSSTPQRAQATVDLTPIYPEAAASLRRGIALLDRARVLVQDEYRPNDSRLPLHWVMITRAAAQISPDGRSATLTQGGHRLRLDLLAPAAARWSAGPARPPTAAEMQNQGCTELSAAAAPGEGESSVRLAVLLSPQGDKWPLLPPPTLQPLADWGSGAN